MKSPYLFPKRFPENALAIENNNKFVRGKNKSRAEIERSVLSHYQMEKLSPEGWEYHLTIP